MNPGPSLRVAIVGAGPSGLPAIKCCLDEGLTPVCFERTDCIGGLWHYTDQPIEGQGCVMRSTMINSSKELMCYSDFPMPAHLPNFMHNSQVLQYLHQYVEKFNLKRHIRFKTEVTSVKKAEDFATTGRWEVGYRNIDTGEATSEVFDGVLVASGHHADKIIPDFPGLNDFKGKVMHSHDYRVPTGFDNKRVLVVGIGNSAVDIAVELTRVAKQVFLSTRRGAWVTPRVSDNGIPMDLLNLNRKKKWLKQTFPWLMEKLDIRRLSKRLDHNLYRLRPAHSPWAYQNLANDYLPTNIVTGEIKVKDNIKQFTQYGVEFKDGSREDDIDVVILATGYKLGYKFLDKEVVEFKENHIDLYKVMYPPDIGKHSLALIGCLQVLGSLVPVAEMQCRLAARVIKRAIQLPDREGMWREIHERRARIAKSYLPTGRYNVMVNYVSYMDELSKVLGCYPDPVALLWKDPKLALTIMFSAAYPSSYRLSGPGQWSEARETVLTAWDRVQAPFRTRPLPEGLDHNSGSGRWFPGHWLQYIVGAAFVLLAYLLFGYC